MTSSWMKCKKRDLWNAHRIFFIGKKPQAIFPWSFISHISHCFCIMWKIILADFLEQPFEYTYQFSLPNYEHNLSFMCFLFLFVANLLTKKPVYLSENLNLDFNFHKNESIWALFTKNNKNCLLKVICCLFLGVLNYPRYSISPP